MAFKNQSELFLHIWNVREHVSEIDGEPLVYPGHPKWHWQFFHIIPKSIYKQAKLSEENILLTTWQQHEAWTTNPGKLKLLSEWIFVFEEYEILKIKYHEGYFK